MNDKPTQQDFLLSILALDAYNLGDAAQPTNVGIDFNGKKTQVGAATVKRAVS